MGIYVGNSEIKSVYIGTTPVREVYMGNTKIRPTNRTFTVTFTENSNPANFNPIYSDDAAGLTPGSTAFDEFFGYSAVRLNSAGVETAEITQSGSGGAGKLDITQLGTLTSGDNVMIKFPVRGIKMSKSGSTITLSITSELNKAGYQYYAHSRGTLSNPGTTKDAFYIGAYEGYISSGVLKSWSGQTISGNYTIGDFISYARANDGNTGDLGYDIYGFYQRQFINALYMMKYGNPDCKNIVGKGRTKTSLVTSGQTNNQINSTYGVPGYDTVAIKLFGIENWRGNADEFVGGAGTDGSRNLWTALHGFTASNFTSSPYENTGSQITTNSSYRNIQNIAGNNKVMFAPIATMLNNQHNSWWCALGNAAASGAVLCGGTIGDTLATSAFYINIGASSSTKNQWFGARLMYL